MLVNPQVTLPNGDDFELDVLTAIGPQIYWVEAKSGDYQGHIAKYSKIARSLGLGTDRSFIVLAEAEDSLCEKLTTLFSMTVCNTQNFKKTLLQVVRRDIALTRKN